MHADVCHANDEASLQRFRRVLRDLGAVLEIEVPVPGMSMCSVRIGNEYITIYGDEEFVDISGSPEIVHKVLGLMKSEAGNG